jgi:hypothetical protein
MRRRLPAAAATGLAPAGLATAAMAATSPTVVTCGFDDGQDVGGHMVDHTNVSVQVTDSLGRVARVPTMTVRVAGRH